LCEVGLTPPVDVDGGEAKLVESDVVAVLGKGRENPKLVRVRDLPHLDGPQGGLGRWR